MTASWAARLPIASATALGAIRDQNDIQLLEQEESLWITGPELREKLEAQIRCLPGAERYQVMPDRQLIPAGRLTPQGLLPEGRWCSLREWLHVQPGTAIFSGTLASRMPVRLVRSSEASEANVLRIPFESWRQYVLTAPRVRLDRWTFAKSTDNQVLIRGLPLPSLFGEQFVEESGIVVPVGWTWAPAIKASILRQVLKLEEGDLALFSTAGHWDRIREDDFVQASPSAVR